MASKLVQINEICIILAGEGHPPLTQKSISVFVSDGMPKAARGMYDPQACTHWYLGRLRTSVRRKEAESEDGERVSLDKQQIRLIGAKADNEEMTAAERRANLLPLEVYEAQMAKLVQVVKMKFLNLPPRLAPKLEGLSRNEMKALLTAAVKDTLTELARNGHVTHGSSIDRPAPAAAKRTRARAARKPRPRKR